MSQIQKTKIELKLAINQLRSNFQLLMQTHNRKSRNLLSEWKSRNKWQHLMQNSNVGFKFHGLCLWSISTDDVLTISTI